MIGLLGLAASVAGAGSALIGVVAAIRAGQGRLGTRAPVRAAWCAFGALALANGLMIAALVGRDFSIAYVAQVGSRETPLLFTIASLWAALDGSILFWGGLLAGVSVLLVVRTHGPDRERLSGALAVLLALTAFFALIVVGPGNPWRRLSPAPLDGPGPNPLLQEHPLMAIHPPLLYLGLVGLAIPFAITVDALVRRRLDERWLRLARSWTLGPWILLTLGLITGGWWSYAVLGWGGYWGWDPVENVALLPWLTSTAFLHSAMVGRRQGTLLAWNVVLVAASFALTILATLVTRSGILASVHAFTRSAIGPLFVGLLGAILVGTIGLLALRLPDAPPGRMGARGRAFLLNNLLFVAIMATVLFGTVFPLVAEALAGTRVSVGAPYFERLVGPLAVGLLVLVGVGPSLPWGEWSAASRATLVPGAAVAAGAAVVLTIAGAPAAAIAGGSAGVFALVQSVSFLARRPWRPQRGSEDAARLGRLNSRAVGGLVSHAGFAILALAVVGSATGKREAVVALTPGGSAEALGQTLTFVASEERPGPNRTVIAASIALADGSRVSPALNIFRGSTQAIATPAIVPGAVTDLYITLLNVDEASGAVTLRVGTHPLVSWIWPAGGLVALGGALALVAAPLRRRRASRAVQDGGDPAPVPTSPAAIDVATR